MEGSCIRSSSSGVMSTWHADWVRGRRLRRSISVMLFLGLSEAWRNAVTSRRTEILHEPRVCLTTHSDKAIDIVVETNLGIPLQTILTSSAV